ncbi:MAG: hypothetical protein ACRENV_03675 [Candidatus Dormibacteria bacterium]
MGTLAAGVALLVPGVNRPDLGRIYVLALAALVIYYLVLDLHHEAPLPEPADAEAGFAAGQLPAELGTIQDLLRASRSSRADFDREVRPLLREVARDRLLTQGISLPQDRERAAALLGPVATMAILEEGPSQWGGNRGPRLAQLQSLLDTLEGIGR